MNLLLAPILGLIVRHALSGVGAVLIAQNIDPKVVEAVTSLITALGPVGGAVAGAVAIGGAMGWSYWQKKRSGAV